jgi:hypothetical protein
MMTDRDKLNALMEAQCLDEEDLALAGVADDADGVPGICMNADCGYTDSVEPGCGGAYCPLCNTASVVGGDVLVARVFP